MKFTLDWLKDHLETSKDLKTITDTLTNIGLEIESVEDKSEDFKNFTVAKVIKVAKHPDADKLKVCQVKTINGEFQVVCGAPNAKEGMLGILNFTRQSLPFGSDAHLALLTDIWSSASPSTGIVRERIPFINPSAESLKLCTPSRAKFTALSTIFPSFLLSTAILFWCPNYKVFIDFFIRVVYNKSSNRRIH